MINTTDKKTIKPEVYFERYLKKFPDNRLDLTVEDFHTPRNLATLTCKVHRVTFQIEPYALVCPGRNTYGCRECGREAKREAMQKHMRKQWQDPEYRKKMLPILLANGDAYLNGPSKPVVQIAEFLREQGIRYQGGDKVEEEFVIPDTLYRFDFYLPDHKIFIEYHGKQHHNPDNYLNQTRQRGLNLQERDRWKADWAKRNGYNLKVISYKDKKNIRNILTDLLLK